MAVRGRATWRCEGVPRGGERECHVAMRGSATWRCEGVPRGGASECHVAVRKGWHLSGDMYACVPTKDAHISFVESSSAARPKSEIFTSPSELSRMFPGFMSRCT